MIASLRGRLVHKDTEGVIIECGGVGYGVAMSLASLARLGPEESETRVLVYTHVSQDSLRLFGFIDAAERETFEVLLGTAGVGPRLALAILSTLSPGELAEVIANSDKATLTRIPGVGPKKAERLLVELKGRLALQLGSSRPPRDGDRMADLVSALVNLGFAAPIAERAAQHAVQEHPDEADLTCLVREALRSTTRR